MVREQFGSEYHSIARRGSCRPGSGRESAPRRVRIVVAVLSLCLLTACTPRPAGWPSGSYDNLVFPSDFPDPFVLAVEEGYYAFATNSGSFHVRTIYSPDLTEWKAVGDALPRLPGWAARTGGLTWAPGVLERDDVYVLYYTRHVFCTDGRYKQCASTWR